MSDQSSGVYVIDQDYNIVSYNQTIKGLYPQLKKGKKCHQCLMNLDAPCPPCPVANHVCGPQTYMDPIRGIYETVDAVEMDLGGGQVGHALVCSTVGESEMIAAKLPKTQAELDRLLEQEYYDVLTEGYSRKGFIRETERLFKNADQTVYAIVMFDIHNFKAVNDIFGLEGGDQVLKYVFETLRTSWLSPVVSARIESDWFVFLVEKEKIESKSLNDILNIEWHNDSRTVHLHLRCGVYKVENRQVSVHNMIEWAILAKEFAGRKRYGNVVLFNETMRKSYIDHAEIISSFQNSIRNQDFKVYYQPIIRTRDEKIVSAEALVRWLQPEMGFVGPNLFIPALEKSGLITQLDRYVLKHVYAFQEALMNRGMTFVPVSVNLSRQDFYNEHLMNDILNLSRKSALPKGAVNYEVTETSVAVLRQNCAYLLKQIQQMGAAVLLDDFGSGYSSLGMIGDYPFDIVKIDKSFIDQIVSKPTVRAVITSTIEMCHKIGLKTVAEGVETAEQLDFLKRHHCDYIQGYYYSKPMDEDTFFGYLMSNQDEIAQEDLPTNLSQGQEVDFDNLVDLVDHSGQFIQVCYPEDYTMVFANAMTRQVSGHPDKPYQGEKCYRYMLGFDAPCGHCPMKQMGGETEKNIEVDDGSHIFDLKGRYAKWNGRKVFIEYGRDVTATKADQRRYAQHIQSIVENVPDGQGIFHVDLTDDKWLSSGGNAQNARRMQYVKDVDTLIRMIGSFVPDEEGQKRFFETFNREKQLASYAEEKYQIILETLSYYDDRSIRWSRITAQIVDNPENGHIESLIYGVDISKEKTHIQELEIEREKAGGLASPEDYRRYFDSLTGLNNRLDLHDALNKAPFKAVMMLDLDDFNKVNDTYGFSAGDQVLRVLGKIFLDFGVKNEIKFYRYAGKTFVGLSRNEGQDIQKAATTLLEIVRQTRVALDRGEEAALTASLGYTTKADEGQKMIDRAYQAMHLARRRGKDQVACVD
jgi:diguanylate cyclase (GGDEF)-like protein